LEEEYLNIAKNLTTQVLIDGTYYAVNIDISNLTGTKYLTVVACYDQSTVNYSNGIYITDLILE
jgi:hypothetical protein